MLLIATMSFLILDVMMSFSSGSMLFKLFKLSMLG